MMRSWSAYTWKAERTGGTMGHGWRNMTVIKWLSTERSQTILYLLLLFFNWFFRSNPIWGNAAMNDLNVILIPH